MSGPCLAPPGGAGRPRSFPAAAGRLLAATACLVLAACGGGSSSGGGTASPGLAGTYQGSTDLTVSSGQRTRQESSGLKIFVHDDGLVQIGHSVSTIVASTPLLGERIDYQGEAAALVDPACTGSISLQGVFRRSSDTVVFNGAWSSSGVSCFGVPGDVRGAVNARRVEADARASRVFETASPVLTRAFRSLAAAR